jgi:cell division protein FtsW
VAVTTSTHSPPDTTARQTVGGWLRAGRAALDKPATSYYLVFGSAALLLTLGLVMVLSASSVWSMQTSTNHSAYSIFLRQAVWVAVGLPLALAASRMPLWLMRRLAYIGLLLAIVLLTATFVPHLGVTVNGNRNWVQLGSSSLRIQPSEFAKLAMVIWSASVLAAKGRRLADPRHLIIPLIPVFGLLLALVLGGRDLGTALVLFAITLVTLFIVGVPLRWFVIAVILVLGVIGYLVSQSPNRMRRVLSFSDPMSDPLGTGWQASHSFFALASGGWWGVGIGASKEKWGALPAAHTDFILAVIGEELGLAGTLVVLFLFLTLAYAGIRIAMRARNTFVTFAAVEIVAWLMAQALVNFGAVTGLLPIAGIPLPLISYGGSAMLPTLMAVGLLLNFARQEPGAAEALAGSSLRHRLGLARRKGAKA